MKHTDIQTTCPTCGRVNEAASNPDGAVPSDGDVSICWSCGGVGLFDISPLGTSVRKPTDEEMASLMSDPGIQSMISAIHVSNTPTEAMRRVRP